MYIVIVFFKTNRIFVIFLYCSALYMLWIECYLFSVIYPIGMSKEYKRLWRIKHSLVTEILEREVNQTLENH